MARYLEILASQAPFTYGADENNRVIFACNFEMCVTYPVDKFEEEIYTYLYDTLNVIGGLGVNTFIGPTSGIPSSSGNVGPFVHLNRTTGYAPYETHNGDKYERLSMQITARSVNYIIARNKMLDIWRALDGRRNVTITAP